MNKDLAEMFRYNAWANRKLFGAYRYPKRFFLVHAIEHGAEHRTEVKVALLTQGLKHLTSGEVCGVDPASKHSRV